MTTDWKRWICVAWLLLIPLCGNAATPMIATYQDGSLFLNSDGSVWGTGNITNYYPGATSPLPLLQLPNVVAIASDDSVTNFALLADGTLWGSGQGRLIDGTTEYHSQPLRVPGISGIKAIAVSGHAVSGHVLALKEDGTVWAWGRNDSGQLGDGTKTDRYVPAPVSGLTNVTKVAASHSDSLALKSDGTVWVWGYTCCGAAGNGYEAVNPTDPEYYHLVPTQVHNLDQVVAIAAGHGHHMALRADGTVWTWGYGGSGENGTGSTGLENNQPLPVQIPGFDDIVAIEAKASSFALKADGTVWAWGANTLGVLGVSGIAISATPIQVPGLSDIVAISAAWTHVVAMRRDGTVFAWGANDNGQLGNGWLQDQAPPGVVLGPGGSGQLNLLQPAPTSFNQLPTGQISLSVASGRAPLTVEAIAADAADPDGTVKAFYWKSGDGQQATGQSATFVFTQAGTYNIDLLIEDDAGGRGSVRQFVVVAPVNVVVSATPKVGMSQVNSVALANDGRILAWGASWRIGLYDANLQATLPQANSIPIANGISGAVDIAVGGTAVHVLLADGPVLGWGQNIYGEVGSGSHACYIDQPRQLPGLPPAQAIAAGHGHAFALTRDGRVFSWGNNTYGQLGVGDNQNRSQPVEVTGLTNIVSIAAGYFFSVALKSDGSVWGWGQNTGYELGDGTQISRTRPIQIPGLANITKIFATPFAVIAQTADGTAWVTGNVVTQISGDPGPGSGPRRLPIFDGFVQIAGGIQFIVALNADGTVWTGGLQSSLALGIANSGDIAGLQRVPGVSDVISIGGGWFGVIALRRDGTVLSWGLNNYGQLGDGTLALRLTPVLVVNETVNGPLDLVPEVANNIPQNLIPPFFLATYSSGSLGSTTLYADVRGITAGGTLASAGNLGNAPVGTLAAGGYNVYVAAGVPSSGAPVYYQLDSSNHWSALTWPMADFMRGVELGSQDALVRVQILQNVDVSPYIGASILVGYGTDPDEMLSNARYRTIFTVTQPQ